MMKSLFRLFALICLCLCFEKPLLAKETGTSTGSGLSENIGTASCLVTIKSVSRGLSCARPSITLTATTSAASPTFVWSTGATTATIDVTIAGTYAVTMTSGTCTSTASVVISGNGAPLSVNISGPTTLSCARPLVTLTANAGGSTYLWNTGETTAAINVTTPGTYTVVKTRGTCTATASKVVTGSGVPPAATLTGDTALSCSKPSVKLTASSAGTNPKYKWSTGASTAAINVSYDGEYTVTVTNGSCKSTLTKVVTGISPLIVNVTSPSTLLSCSRTSIRLTAAAIATNPTYKWSTGETTRQIIVTTAGTYSVEVSSEGCTTIATKVITGNTEQPTVSISGSPVFSCGQTSLTLTASSTWPGATYEWSNGVKTASVTVSNIGKYTVIMYTGSCTAYASVNVTVNCNNARTAATDDETIRQNVPLAVTIFPNPVHEKLDAEISSNGTNPVQIRLLNQKGISITDQNLPPIYGKQKISMGLGRFAIGLYFLEVVSGEEKVYKRVMIN
jgi:hypothetical protein